MSCEHCWTFASLCGEEYSVVLKRAEAEGWRCTKNTVEGARLRGGQFWDEATQSDKRTKISVLRPSPVEVDRG